MIFFSTLSNFLLLFSKNGISKCRCKSPAKQSDFIAWWTSCIDNDKLDFIDFEPKDIKTKEELLSYFDKHPFVDGEARTANRVDGLTGINR